jgi:hypothetical protein
LAYREGAHNLALFQRALRHDLADQTGLALASIVDTSVQDLQSAIDVTLHRFSDYHGLPAPRAPVR